MSAFKLANVVVRDTRQFNTAPQLFYRSSATLVPGDDGIGTLVGPGTFDFTTFFNALSTVKWQRYTVAEGFRLHLDLLAPEGATVEQTRCDSYSYYSEVVPGTAVEVPASYEWQTLDLDLAIGEFDVLDAFQITCPGQVRLRHASYWASVDESLVRDVELAIATTTFRKEAYITKNIELVREQIIESDEPIAAHFTMHVIDNGRTLDREALESPGIEIHPNQNVGGAGGFTRGMIEAMRQEHPATHVLLMDDDVEVFPESIIRTYNLLALARDKYAEAFVSGAMMSYDEVDVRHEDVGYFTFAGTCNAWKPPEHMSSIHGIVQNETFLPDFGAWEDVRQYYAAWWYCCIPTSLIRKNGLPLPLFVRFDDAEFGMRCNPEIMTMNGICVWHKDFYLRYSAASERYQTPRNVCVIRATTDVAPLTDPLREVERCFQLEMVKFNYADAELVLRGFEDFLEGPEHVFAKGFAERSFMDANRCKDKYLPLAEARPIALERYGIDIARLGFDDVTRDLPLPAAFETLRFGKKRPVDPVKLFFDTLNGSVDGKSLEANPRPVAVVDTNSLRMGKLYGAKSVIEIDMPNKLVSIREKNRARAQALCDRYRKDLRVYADRGERIRKAYADFRPRVTSLEYWKDYLDL